MEASELPENLIDFYRQCRVDDLGQGTIETYRKYLDHFRHWVDSNEVENITRATVQDFMVFVQERPVRGGNNRRTCSDGRLSRTTVKNIHTALKQFFRWAQAEGLCGDLMRGVKAPKKTEAPIPVLSDLELQAILRACNPINDSTPEQFYSVRDRALLRVFIDCGVRLSEATGIRVDDLYWDTSLLRVTGKFGKTRDVPFGDKTGLALRRYLRARRKHQQADHPELFVGVRGPLSSYAVRRVIEKRATRAGIGHIHPHQFRHTLAHRWLAEGLGEIDLIRLMGWSGTAMLAVYGRSAGSERAHEAHRRAGLGDRL